MTVNLTFIDGDNKKYVVPLTQALREKYGPFFKETRLKEESTHDNAVIRLSDDPPAAVAAVVQVLQHGTFTVPGAAQVLLPSCS